MTSEETECDREPMEALIFDRPSDPADLPMTAFRITAGITQPPLLLLLLLPLLFGCLVQAQTLEGLFLLEQRKIPFPCCLWGSASQEFTAQL